MGGKKSGGNQPDDNKAHKPVSIHRHQHDEDEDEGEGADEEFNEPEGMASLPEIPEDLGIDPMLIAVLESVVFLSGSEDDLVHPDAADAVIDRILTVLTRLDATRRARVLEDLKTLRGHVSGPDWPAGMAEFVDYFAESISSGGAE
jgi:hypothetical protein